MRGGPGTLEDSAVAEERTKDLRRTDSVGLRLGSVCVACVSTLVWCISITRTDSIQVIPFLATSSYVMRPDSARTSPPHVSPSSVSDASPLEAMTYTSWAVIVKIR